jgi:hypothetical protein
MASLLDLASDLINEAKLAPQSDKKLYKLEQVKEIIFHRDPSLLPLVIPEIFELMLDRSVAVRRFLVRLAGDALQVTQEIVPDALTLFSFLLVEGNEKLLESIAQVLSRQYDKISITIALMTPKTTDLYQQPNFQQQHQQQQHDPKNLWYQFRSMCSTLIECISAQRSDNLRCQCLKMCEQMVLFALLQTSGGSTLQDPRLRQTSGTKTIQEISMHHAFINRVELEKEADSLLAKMVLWARRGGSQQAPFSPMVQCRLGQTLALVATERPSALKTIIPALHYLLLGGADQGAVCAQMTAVGRQQLSVSILRLLRVAPKHLSAQGPEHDQLLQLRQAVDLLDDSKTVSSSSSGGGGSGGAAPASSSGSSVVTLLSGVHSSDPRKRKLEERAAAAALLAQQKADSLKQEVKSESVEGAGTAQSEYTGYEEEADDDYDEDLNLDEEAIRQHAVSAVEAHLSISQPSKRAKLDDLLDDLTGRTAPASAPVSASASAIALPLASISTPTAPPLSSSSSGVAPTTTHSNITSLASDLGDLPSNSVGNSLRLVSLIPSGTGGNLQAIPPPVEVYSDLSLGSLAKLINQTILVLPHKNSHASLLSSCLELKLVMRMILSMSVRDFDQHRAFLQLMTRKVLGAGTVTRQSIQHVPLLKSRGHHARLLRPDPPSSELGVSTLSVSTSLLAEVPKVVLLPRYTTGTPLPSLPSL